MADYKQMLWIFLLVTCQRAYSTTDETTDHSKEETLVESESKDGKLEIVKQIKKVNDDGSYTIGYEADDGTFKIESRDVLGNIKGTYGYIDDSGQIKRVSYSTSNSSEVINKPDPASVVQRIPLKMNKTHSSTTRRPFSIYSSTTPSSTTIRRRPSYSSTYPTTTIKPNYSEVLNANAHVSKTTSKPTTIVYATTAAPRVLLQGRSSVARSTPSTHTQTQNSEGQLIRPEIVTARPTELPLFRRLAIKNPLLDGVLSKPVTEEPEVKSNILRRQLSQEKSEFDVQSHVFSLQQSAGDDASDVYGAGSVSTTGTPRPLFTTTLRPKILSSSTSSPIAVVRPTIRYPNNYRNLLQDEQPTTPEYTQETSTTEAALTQTTPTSVPVVQIPANRGSDPLVAIRHPFQRGSTILVPLSHLQSRVLPIESIRELNDNLQPQIVQNQQEQYRETTQKPPEDDPRAIFVRRLPPPQFRPIPVHVDQNGYIREVNIQQAQSPTPYPLPIPITPAPKFVNNDVDNDIENISPPVSTRDFQKLLQQLIIRQRSLERISVLSDQRRPEYFQPRYRPVYQQQPYFIPRNQPQNGPVQFIPDAESQNQRNRYIQSQNSQQQQQQLIVRNQQQQLYNQPEQFETVTPQSYVPTRRVARLLQNGNSREQQINEEFLPPDVREMLLLRMLQLAINPALPVDVEDGDVEPTATVPQYKKVPVRNVEILGEETESKRPVRSKRYKENENMDYYE